MNEIQKLDITNEIKKIMGNVVECAYTFTDDDRDRYPLESADKNKISLPSNFPVFIKLKNGKSFSIWISEFGELISQSEEEYFKEHVN